MFTDCLGREIIVGEDVIVSLGRNSLHCGIVSEITETELRISCQFWRKDGDYDRIKVFQGEKGKANKIRSVYKESGDRLIPLG